MEEAAKIIYKYHGGEDNEVAKLEVREIAQHVKMSKPQTPGQYIRGLWDYRELFNSHSARWRTAMVTLITFASSLAGNTILTCELSVISNAMNYFTDIGSFSTNYVGRSRSHICKKEVAPHICLVNCLLLRSSDRLSHK